MNTFIEKLAVELDIQIKLSNDLIHYKNSYKLSKDGKITGLSLYNTKLKSLERLRPVADHLKELVLIDNAVDKLEPLKHFSKLERLVKYKAIPASEIKHILKLTGIKFLELGETEITDTSCLGDLAQLEHLYIGSSFSLNEVKGLEKLLNLKYLDCSGSKFLSIEQICGHEGIDCLRVSCSELEKMSGIERFPNLAEIDLSSTGITKIEGLESLQKLQKLNISASNLKKISGLDNQENLEILHLGYSDITKIEGLDALVNLRRLNLRECKIRKAENLASLESLEYLGLEMNEIEEIDTAFLSSIRNPCKIYLGGNKISSKNIDKDIPEHIELSF